LIPKHVRRFTGFDDKIIAMYARGMTVREIQGFPAEQLRISVDGDHPFRSKPITRFAPSRSPISDEADHPFRTKPITG
jgi:hypothetical protein